MSSLHFQRDQSYRIPRREQAQRVSGLAQELRAQGKIAPPQLLDAPLALFGNAHPVNIGSLFPGYSQPAALSLEGTVGVLIFGSSTKPGGGWRNGAKAQEEDISLHSTWGVQAEAAPAGFYTASRDLGGIGPDKVLLAHGYWLLDVHGNKLATPRPVVFADVAAPNRGHPKASSIAPQQHIDHLARRLAGALIGWQHAGVSDVVMGAIGCGVFKWPVAESATALRMAFNHVRALGNPMPQLHLALPDESMRGIFTHTLHEKVLAPSPKRR